MLLKLKAEIYTSEYGSGLGFHGRVGKNGRKSFLVVTADDPLYKELGGSEGEGRWEMELRKVEDGTH